MGNFSVFQKWAGLVIFLVTIYDLFLNQFVAEDTREKYYLYSLGLSLEMWIIILLALLVVTFLWNNRRLGVEGKTVNNHKSNSARDGVIQDIRDSQIIKDSFNQAVYQQPAGYEMPTKQQILRRIGVEIQELEDQFDIVRYKMLKDKYNEWVKAHEIFEKIRIGVLRQAKIELKGSQILSLFKSLEIELNKYPIQISLALQNEEERQLYLSTDKAYLPTVIDRINKDNAERDRTEATIILDIQQIISLSRGNDGNEIWLISGK